MLAALSLPPSPPQRALREAPAAGGEGEMFLIVGGLLGAGFLYWMWSMSRAKAPA